MALIIVFKMKIIHIITSLNIGGAEIALQKLLMSKKNDTPKPSVISLTELGKIGEQLQKQNFETHCLHMKNALYFPVTLIKLIKILSNEKPDIVQTWLYHADLLGGIAAKIAGIKNILWGIRTTELKKGSFITAIIRQVCALLSYFIPTRIICVATASMNKHVSLGYARKKMLVIGNGFELEHLQFDNLKRETLRAKYNIDENNIVIGSLGRFSEDKGQEIFLKSAKILNLRNTNIHFLIIGKGINKDNEQLISWINDANLGKNITLLEEQSDILACLSAMDIFCLHSRTEGFPNVLGEAMAVGLPCVATNVGDVKHLLSDTGVIVDKNNPLALVEGLELLINNSIEQNKSLGSKARMRIEQEFTINQTRKKFDAVYTSLLNGEV